LVGKELEGVYWDLLLEGFEVGMRHILGKLMEKGDWGIVEVGMLGEGVFGSGSFGDRELVGLMIGYIMGRGSLCFGYFGRLF